EGVWYGSLTPDGVRVRVQMERIGVSAQCQGTSGIKSDTVNETAGSSAEGTLAFVEGAPTEKLPGGRRFLEAYAKAAFREPSEAYGPFAYVAANLVIDAIEAVGPDRAKVAARLKRTRNATTNLGPVGFTLFFGVLDVIHFSHGDIFMLGAFTGLTVLAGLRAAGVGGALLALPLTFAASILVTGAVGVLAERVCVKPLARASPLMT